MPTLSLVWRSDSVLPSGTRDGGVGGGAGLRAHALVEAVLAGLVGVERKGRGELAGLDGLLQRDVAAVIGRRGRRTAVGVAGGGLRAGMAWGVAGRSLAGGSSGRSG